MPTDPGTFGRLVSWGLVDRIDEPLIDCCVLSFAWIGARRRRAVLFEIEGVGGELVDVDDELDEVGLEPSETADLQIDHLLEEPTYPLDRRNLFGRHHVSRHRQLQLLGIVHQPRHLDREPLQAVDGLLGSVPVLAVHDFRLQFLHKVQATGLTKV